MNQLSPGPHDSNPTGPDTKAGTATPAGAKDAAGPRATPAATGAPAAGNPGKYDAAAGPFTIRDLTVFGSVLLMFVGSLLPMFGERYNLWNLGNLFFILLGIILPLIVVALFVARRLQPTTVIRVGSLSIDQFASVIASFAFPLFFLTIANSYNGSVLLGMVGSVGLLAATVLAPHLPWLSADFKGRQEVPAHVVAREAAVPSRKPAAPKEAKPGTSSASTAASRTYTPPASSNTYTPAASAVVPAAAGATPGGTSASSAESAPAVVHAADADSREAAAPVTSGDSPAAPASASTDVTASTGPATTQAHSTQAPAAQAPAAHAPAAPAPAAPQQPWAATMATPVVSGDTRKVSDSIGATVDPASRPEESDGPAYEAFWFAVAQPRTAYDEHSGAPAFTIEPGGWVLALEDRGHEFLVQDTDGKVGVLRDLSNVERG